MKSLSIASKLSLVATAIVGSAADSSQPCLPQRRLQQRRHTITESNNNVGTSGLDRIHRGGAVIPSLATKSPKSTTVPSSSSSVSATTAASSSILHRLKVTFYFGLWYALNVYYNIINKKLLNVLPLPVTIGSLQLGVGAFYIVVLWFCRIRAIPAFGQGSTMVSALKSVGFWHCLGQLFSMVSLGAGPVSFTHIVKALEPLFSAVISGLWLGQWMAWPVYLTLLPVVGGVGYACLKERYFSWLAFGMAMGSNVAFAFRAVLSKVAMMATSSSLTMNHNWTSANIFGLVTIFAFIMSIPMALMGEGRIVQQLWDDVTVAKVVEKIVEEVVQREGEAPEVIRTTHLVTTPPPSTPLALLQAIVVSGLFHYLNNEVMYLALGNVHPVTLAVGNTMKRVFIMAASVLVFRNPISLQAGIGSAIGIGGVLLYSLTKQRYEQAAVEQRKLDGKPRTPASKSLGSWASGKRVR